MGESRPFERRQRVSVTQYDLPAVGSSPQYVCCPIHELHLARGGIRPLMMLKVDGVGHVVPDPPDEVVTAGTAPTTVGSRRVIKPTGDVLPTTDVTSVRAEDDHVVGMSQQALPQLRISFEHAQVSGVDLLEKPIDVVRNRIVHLSSSPPLPSVPHRATFGFAVWRTNTYR